ncbi:CDP-diacylglycerol--glycerol-3-phosphate 3-phosphatidyltransferase [Candidatus Aerophobetes bacterium]|nr:CDP-diacylglycerol--glycerol-3-phosphate 3-phosphatidyltransferase [Candidatus Aerophobetes bacterium]
MNTANKITLFRIALVPFFIVFLFIFAKVGVVFSLFIFTVASFSDWLDGYVARKKNEVTVTGKIIDPVADKILVYSAFICFIYLHIIPFWMVIVIMARDFLVMALRVELAATGFVLASSMTAKLKTVLEYVALFFVFFYLLFDLRFFQIFMQVFIYSAMGLACIFAVVSGIEYFLQGRRMLIK